MPSIVPAPRRSWPLPLALFALCLVPALAGGLRLAQIGGPVTAENARFLNAPLASVLHLAPALCYGLAAPLQFVSRLRRRPGLHRRLGRVLVVCGALAALAGVWMTLFWPAAPGDTPLLALLRIAAGSAMLACLTLGVAAVVRHDMAAHGRWMMRAYALGMGAGTQVLTHLPYFLFPGIQGPAARTLCMAAGWLINIALVEWLIRRRPRLPA